MAYRQIPFHSTWVIRINTYKHHPIHNVITHVASCITHVDMSKFLLLHMDQLCAHLANGFHNQLQPSPAMYPLVIKGCLPQVYQVTKSCIGFLKLAEDVWSFWETVLIKWLLWNVWSYLVTLRLEDVLIDLDRLTTVFQIAANTESQFVWCSSYLEKLSVCSWAEPIQTADSFLGSFAEGSWSLHMSPWHL